MSPPFLQQKMTIFHSSCIIFIIGFLIYRSQSVPSIAAAPVSHSASTEAAPQNTANTTANNKPDAKQQIIQAYFQGQRNRIDVEAKKKNHNIDNCRPTDTEIAEAINSSNIESTAAKKVIIKLQTCYEILDVVFFPPIAQ